MGLTIVLGPRVLDAEGPPKAAAPDWVIPDATIEMDFEHNRYYNASLDDLTNPSVRMGQAPDKYRTDAYAATKTGVLQRFEANQLRRTDLGLLIEASHRNRAFWSRDLTKPVWIATNMKAEPAPIGADGKPGGTRLTALADGARVVQEISTDVAAEWGPDADVKADNWDGGHMGFFIKRVSGSGTVKILHYATGKPPGASADASALLNATAYIPVSIGSQLTLKDSFGLELGAKGDVVDVDMAQYEFGVAQNFMAMCAPMPNEDKDLRRRNDYIVVNPQSALYRALAGKSGTLFLKTFNLLGDHGAFYTFVGPKEHATRTFLCYAEGLSLVVGESKMTYPFTSGDGERPSCYTWMNPKFPGPMRLPLRSMPHYGATMRTVLAWGGGKATIVVNNGEAVTGDMAESVADGTLVLGYARFGYGPHGAHRDSTYQCSGYIQDIAFMPDVLPDHGAKLTVGPKGPPPEMLPAAKQPK